MMRMPYVCANGDISHSMIYAVSIHTPMTKFLSHSHGIPIFSGNLIPVDIWHSLTAAPIVGSSGVYPAFFSWSSTLKV